MGCGNEQRNWKSMRMAIEDVWMLSLREMGNEEMG